MGRPWVEQEPNCKFNVLTHQVTYLVYSLAFLSAGRSKVVNDWRQGLSLLLYSEAEAPSEVFTGGYCFVLNNNLLGEEGTGGSATSQHPA